jgi:Domain of unknown function (DUF6046)
MAEISFDLSTLFEQTFGYRTQAFSPEFDPLINNSNSQFYANDALGNEYFLPVTITWQQATPIGQSTTATSWDLPYPIVSITARKTIIETALTERRGTVKELINSKDFEITVKGFIIGDDNEFPQDDVTMLRTLYEQNAAVGIANALTDIFLLRPDRSGSDQVVITGLHLPEVKGIKNVRPYQLTMLSDEPFNLIAIS